MRRAEHLLNSWALGRVTEGKGGKEREGVGEAETKEGERERKRERERERGGGGAERGGWRQKGRSGGRKVD